MMLSCFDFVTLLWASFQAKTAHTTVSRDKTPFKHLAEIKIIVFEDGKSKRMWFCTTTVNDMQQAVL